MKDIALLSCRSFLSKSIKPALPALLLLGPLNLFAQPKVIPLYKGAAPGSEHWNWKEGETVNNPTQTRIAYNVVNPTLTVFTPDPAMRNGCAVIVSPGGGLQVLLVEKEGEQVAKALTQKGITVFLLKYRLARLISDDPWKEMMTNLRDTTKRMVRGAVRPLAIEDLKTAITYVKQQAATYGVDEKRVGLLGFSAGAGLSANFVFDFTPAVRPAFAGFIYSAINMAGKPALPANPPPVFIAAATDDTMARPSYSVDLYNHWIRSGYPAELHLYGKGGHGLHGYPANTWIARFTDWLQAMGFLKPGE